VLGIVARMHHIAHRVDLQGIHCSMNIRRLRPGLVVIAIRGTDIGELADAPFCELECEFRRDRPLELFIDARDTRGASIDVSNDWALWLAKYRDRLRRVTMLTGSRFIAVTARFVRRFSQLENLMRITTDPVAFDGALEQAIRER
jgi:hypothetical protein